MNISISFAEKAKEIKEKSLLRFNDWSKKYDKSVLQQLVFRRSHDMFIMDLVQDKKPFRLLDVGCGTGEFILKLREQRNDLSIYGMDISDEMINVAKQKSRLDNGLDFKIGDVENMPYEDNYFDYITCSHSFHHYPNKRKAVREMHRVLKNNGKVMIIDGYKDRLLGKFIFDFVVKRHEADAHHLHSSQFLRIMAKAGFRNIIQTVFNPVIPLLLVKGVANKEA